MSTEQYLACPECEQKIHIGTRYAGGCKFFTIGATKKEAEAFWGEHVCCDGNLLVVSEYDERYTEVEP